MKTTHKHAEAIKSWADGEVIQYLHDGESWWDTSFPSWCPTVLYRVKPAPKPDLVFPLHLSSGGGVWFHEDFPEKASNMVCTFDSETLELKSVRRVGKPCPEKMEAFLKTMLLTRPMVGNPYKELVEALSC